MRVPALLAGVGMLVAMGALEAQAPELLRVDSLIVAGDVPGAVAAIEAEARKTPRDFQVLWRLSRVRLLQGDAAPAQSRPQDRFYRQALEMAERAIKADPQAPEGYVRRAAASGKVALFAGVLDAADYVLVAKEDVEKVIAMPSVDPVLLATAHYILGRTHLKLTETPRPLRMPIGLGFGNLPDALVHLRKARELRPGFVMFELEWARALAADGKDAEARAVLAALPGLADTEPGDAARKAEGADLLKTLR